MSTFTKPKKQPVEIRYWPHPSILALRLQRANVLAGRPQDEGFPRFYLPNGAREVARRLRQAERRITL